MIITKETYSEDKPNALFDIHGTLLLDRDYPNHRFVLNGAVLNEMLLAKEQGKNVVIWTAGTDEEVKETIALFDMLPEKIIIDKIDNETKMMLKHKDSVMYDDKTINPLNWEMIPIAVDTAHKEDIMLEEEKDLLLESEEHKDDEHKEDERMELADLKKEFDKKFITIVEELKKLKEMITKEDSADELI